MPYAIKICLCLISFSLKLKFSNNKNRCPYENTNTIISDRYIEIFSNFLLIILDMISIAVITIIETVIGNINADGGTSLMLFIYKEIIKNKDKTNG